MDIQLSAERILALEERVPFDEIRQRAMDKRTSAFGGGLGGFLQRPKPEEVTLVQQQRRMEPFWHVRCAARYVYERTREYSIIASAPEVRKVDVNGSSYDVAEAGRSFHMPVREHCLEEFKAERFTDGVTGGVVADGPQVAQGPSKEVTDLAALAADGTILVPPEHRASFVVRTIIAEMMKPVQADEVTEESLQLETTDLYYRPIYAFEFTWTPRSKQGVVEIDAITGQLKQAPALVGQTKSVLSRDMLFDITADAAGMFIPGGSIAVKMAKVALDKRG
jgi:hypothetical protein